MYGRVNQDNCLNIIYLEYAFDNSLNVSKLYIYYIKKSLRNYMNTMIINFLRLLCSGSQLYPLLINYTWLKDKRTSVSVQKHVFLSFTVEYRHIFNLNNLNAGRIMKQFHHSSKFVTDFNSLFYNIFCIETVCAQDLKTFHIELNLEQPH